MTETSSSSRPSAMARLFGRLTGRSFGRNEEGLEAAPMAGVPRPAMPAAPVAAEPAPSPLAMPSVLDLIASAQGARAVPARPQAVFVLSESDFERARQSPPGFVRHALTKAVPADAPVAPSTEPAPEPAPAPVAAVEALPAAPAAASVAAPAPVQAPTQAPRPVETAAVVDLLPSDIDPDLDADWLALAFAEAGALEATVTLPAAMVEPVASPVQPVAKAVAASGMLAQEGGTGPVASGDTDLLEIAPATGVLSQIEEERPSDGVEAAAPAGGSALDLLLPARRAAVLAFPAHMHERAARFLVNAGVAQEGSYVGIDALMQLDFVPRTVYGEIVSPEIQAACWYEWLWEPRTTADLTNLFRAQGLSPRVASQMAARLLTYEERHGHISRDPLTGIWTPAA